MDTHRSTPAFSNPGKPLLTLAPPSNPIEKLGCAMKNFSAAVRRLAPSATFVHHSPNPSATPAEADAARKLVEEASKGLPPAFVPEELEAARQRLQNLTQDFPFSEISEPPPTFTDLMVDIEALADLPDSAPAQIALVFFDRDDPAKKFLHFDYFPSPISSMRLGFQVTTSTLLWWDQQNMLIDVQNGDPIEEVLDGITTAIQTHGTKGMRVWSRGNSYDLSILKLAYARTAKKLPWDFWMERDVRTWLEGTGFKSPRKNNHDAVDDATNQALDVIESTHS